MTLRARLIWMLFAVLAPLLLVVGLSLYYFVQTTITARFDDGLLTRAEALIADVIPKGTSVALHFDNEDMPSYDLHASDDEKTAYFELHEITDSGELHLIERSASLRNRPLLKRYTFPLPDGAWNENLEQSVHLRVLADPFIPHASENLENDTLVHNIPLHTPADSPPKLLMLVATSRERLESPLRTLTIGMILAGFTLAIGGILASRWALTKGLIPLERLAREVRSISTSTLGNRLDAGPLPTEIAPIQDRLNELSTRLKLAFDRERRFNTAAAHELRTPVAELRALLEVAALRPRSIQESAHTTSTALESVKRLDHLVSSLLRLSRIEAHRQTAIPEDRPLASLVNDAIAEHLALAQRRSVSFQTSIDPSTIVSADPGLFSIVLRTILANAAEYADTGSTIRIHATREGDDARITISNSASHLNPAESARLGEPFWRQPNVPASADHLGLGLSLAQAAARAANLQLRWAIDATKPQPTFTTTIEIPLQLTSSAAHPAGE